MKMNAYSLIVSLFAVSLLADFVSCSPVQFTKNQVAPQNTGTTVISPVSCTNGSTGICTQHYQVTTTAGLPQANVLFILDTSGSTTDIQMNLANNLSGFVQGLAGIDYRVGLITTDTSSNASDSTNNYPDAVNDNGALQDGNLVAFSDGSTYLTPSSTTTQISVPSIAAAASTCVSSGYEASECLSDDPRAIFAANLLVTNNSGSFLRAGVPTTFIIISDADERNSTSLAADGFKQDANDAPSSLISNFSSQFPSTPFKVDTLTIQPGDQSCYNQRYHRTYNPLIFGFYAPIYASLTQATGGVAGSICNANFTSQIGTITSAAAAPVTTLPLTCSPYQGQYTLQFTNSSGASATVIPSSIDSTNKLQIDLSTPLPSGESVVLSYDCEV